MIILIILLTVLIIGAVILTHEWGHFMAARRNGIEVEEFGFGFPPRIFGIKRGGTIYSINWIPMGGFVRMKGEDEGDSQPGTFNHASLGAKAKVLLAGVFMNFVMAYVILLILTLVGLPKLYDGQFSLGHPTYAQPPAVMAFAISPDAPAARAGIKTGALIESGNSQTFTTETQLQDFTKAHAGQTVDFVIKQDGKQSSLNVKLNATEGDVGYLGVEPLAISAQRYGLWAPLVSLGLLGQLAWKVLAALGGLIALLVHLLIHHSTGGSTAAENVTGPIGIVVILSGIVHLGWSYVAVFVLSICVSLGVINVLPLPALDGGRLFFTLVRRVFKWPSLEREGQINQVGFIILLLLLAVISFFDIKRLH